ncbi:hypothetical protein Baya_3916 [Bagarius yarrelli]|uniref:Uncharacterized protein n=1 Tax=Bagarius yarrelli TaxID=175774 RepID=A0A556TX24_BAGYA|nr:hypothetical protein Baya_3916 [Bagarius yarrelli]
MMRGDLGEKDESEDCYSFQEEGAPTRRYHPAVVPTTDKVLRKSSVASQPASCRESPAGTWVTCTRCEAEESTQAQECSESLFLYSV